MRIPGDFSTFNDYIHHDDLFDVNNYLKIPSNFVRNNILSR